jgi:hypothetical protein
MHIIYGKFAAVKLSDCKRLQPRRAANYSVFRHGFASNRA